MPGDTSELGAALAMNSPAAMGGYGGGLRAFTGGGGGRYGMLGTRQRLMGALGSLVDGAGMPVDTGGILADATAEAGRGLAPLTAAAAVGGLGARFGAKGAHWLLIGKRPDKEQLAKWRKPTADGDPDTGGPSDGGPGGSGGGGPRRPGGPPDRYRDDQGQVRDRRSDRVLHDQHADRTLLSTRAHNRLVRFRGYRILNRGGRAGYGATVGLPANVRRARAGGSQYRQDARQQRQVWQNTVREDVRAWGDTGRYASGVLRGHTDGRSGPGPSGGRRLPTATSPAATTRRTAPPRPATSGGSSGRTVPTAARPSAPMSPGGGSAPPAPAPASPPRLGGSAPRPPASGARSRPVLPGGGGARSSAREEAAARMQELMRRTAPEAERLRQERAQRRDEDGDDE
jgi:hypothetical protein